MFACSVLADIKYVVKEWLCDRICAKHTYPCGHHNWGTSQPQESFGIDETLLTKEPSVLDSSPPVWAKSHILSVTMTAPQLFKVPVSTLSHMNLWFLIKKAESLSPFLECELVLWLPLVLWLSWPTECTEVMGGPVLSLCLQSPYVLPPDLACTLAVTMGMCPS